MRPHDIPAALRERRANEGQSRYQQAKTIGVSERVLRLVEAGATPNPANKLSIATYFGVKVTDLWPIEEQEAA